MNKLSDDNYITVSSKPVREEIKVKSSRFIAHIFHAETKESAEELLSHVRKKYHDATHNCFAWRINANEYRYSDDGEPSGTAGKPIFNIIESKNILRILIVVTRYFGGTKLGTGGLSRAYSEAAIAGLNKCSLLTKTRYTTIDLLTTYDHLQELLHLVNKFNGNVNNSEYAEKIKISVEIPSCRFSGFQAEINNLLQRGIAVII